MKFGFCVAAFIFGCFFAVLMKANDTSQTPSDIAMVQDPIPSTVQQPSVVTPIEMEITKRTFATTKDGVEIAQFICQNKNGYSFEIIEYGATITAVTMPDKNGLLQNITLSCEGLDGYEACTSYFGCTVGRYCNRIAKGKFSIDGKEYTLETNNGAHHLHGGNVGFDKKLWKAEQIMETNFVGVRLKLVSEDGDGGYPGKVNATVEYTLNNDNEFKINFSATTDKTTHVNLTNHNYWNLGGAGSGTILDHQLQLEADQYIPVDGEGIPTGEIANVEGTFFDFRKAMKIGTHFEKLTSDPVGYDHNFVVRADQERKSDDGLTLAATVFCEKSGRKMEVLTNQPGIQFYSGNFLNGQPGSGGFAQHSALCLETQNFPDAPNQPKFPSSLLKPGETYQHTTIHKLSVVK